MEGTSTVENVVQQMIGDMEEMRQQMDEIRKAVATLTTNHTSGKESYCPATADSSATACSTATAATVDHRGR